MTDTPANNYPRFVTASIKLVLAEFQRQQDVYLGALDHLDSKAFNLLGWSSLAITIVSALSFPDLVKAGRLFPFIVLSVVAVSYLVVVALCLCAIVPADYDLPVPIDWDELHDAYLLEFGQTKQSEPCLVRLEAPKNE